MSLALRNSEVLLEGRLNPLQLSRLEMAATLGYEEPYLTHLRKQTGISNNSLENFMRYTLDVIKAYDIFAAVSVLLKKEILSYDTLIGDGARQNDFHSRLGSLDEGERKVMSDIYHFALKYGAFPDPLSLLVEGKDYDEQTGLARISSVCNRMGLTHNRAHLAVVAYAVAQGKAAQHTG